MVRIWDYSLLSSAVEKERKMLLITETVQDNIKLLKESAEDGSQKYSIEGIFMQADKENKNGRNYPSKTLLKEAKRYEKEYVKKNRALGELGHPEGPTVNLDRVSHVIKELWNEGTDIYGRARILDTPMGKIVKGLLNDGVSIGVSTRGMGSIKKNDKGVNEVQDDFLLAAVDIVSDPSAPDAFVNGIMEGKEWVWDNGIIKCRDIETHVKLIENAGNKMEREEKILSAFNSLLKG
jgi:hypothetical protein